MGLLDGIKSLLGTKAEADATRDADPEALFGISTAYITMEAELEYAPTGQAALCFRDVDDAAFREATDEVEAILEAGEVETGTAYEFTEDDRGADWIVLEDEDFEDLVTTIHFAADTLVEAGYGPRLLAALFAFEHERRGHYAYWVYSFRRGAWYPFVPHPHEDDERDSAAEFKLESSFDRELDVEDEKEYWYAFWPDRRGFHPWE